MVGRIGRSGAAGEQHASESVKYSLLSYPSPFSRDDTIDRWLGWLDLIIGLASGVPFADGKKE